MKRRLLALTLTLCLLLSLLPMTTFATGTYEKATSIAVGDTVVFVCDTKKVELSSFNGTSYAKGTTYTSAVAGTMAFEIVAGATEGTVAFKNNDQYVCWTSSNSLKMNSKLNANSSWVVSFDNSGNAIVLNSADNTRKLQWNASSPRFACYTSSQTAIQLYKLTESSSSTTCEHTNTTTSTEAATCTTAGSKTTTCTDCGNVSTETINATGHNYVNGVCINTDCGQQQPDGYYLTDLAAIQSTDKVIITMTNGTTTWALSSSNGTSSAPTAVVVTVTGETVATNATNIFWNIANDNGNLIIYPAGTTNTWLYCTATNNGVRVGTNANKTFTIDATSGYLKHTATSRYVGVYNGQDWRCYTTVNNNISGQTLAFYVYVCNHNWIAADCDTPKTCSKCEITDGYALGHNVNNGKCTNCNQETESYALVTLSEVKAGRYLIGAIIDSTYRLGTASVAKIWKVTESNVSVTNGVIFGLDLPADTQIITLTGNNEDGFSVGFEIDGGMQYLGYSSLYSRQLALGAYGETLWKAVQYEGGLFALTSKCEGGSYVVVNNGTSINGYFVSEGTDVESELTDVTSIYLFREVCYHVGTSTTTTTLDPSCTTAGSTTVTCDDCGEVISTETIDALGHTYEDDDANNDGTWETVTPDTCTGTGEERRKCGRCDAYQTRTIDTITTHIYSDTWYYASDADKPTCLTAGTETRKCTVENCNATETRTVDATGHKLTHHDATAPDCTNDGTIEYWSCSVCKNNYSTNDDKATNTLDSVVDPAPGHSWTDATCTAPKTCSTCSATEGTAQGHAKVKTDANAPTCTKEGNNEYYTCTRTACSKVYKDSACTQETTVAAETIPATGHTPTALDVPVCSVCGEGVTPTTTVLYVKPNTNWHTGNARFAAYFFGNGETWVSAVDTNGDGIYAVEVPAGYPNVIFCRMNPSATANNWNNKWNQTADLTVPTDGTNLYIVKEDTWDNGGGTWIAYPSAYTYTIAGAKELCGTAWDVANTANDMALNADDIYEKVYTNVAAGSYAFKVVLSHSWDIASWPASDYTFSVNEAGSTVTITFDPTTKTVAVKVVAPPHTHSYKATVTAPTCTEAGYTTYTCACGDSYTEAGPAATGHSYNAVVTSPTCTEAGYTTYTCTCTDTYVADQVAALGHSYEDDDLANDGEWVVKTSETCLADGEKRLYCTRCNDTNAYQSQVIDEISGHSYTYVADDTADTITESCSNGCKHSVTVTLKAPENAVYNASSWAATATVTGTIVAEYAITYGSQQPINAGTYTATLTVAGKSVSVTFEIAKAASTATAPTANTLTYNGKDQALITAGTATGGTMQYSLDGTTWGTAIPIAKDAGTYTVYYKVVGNENYNDVATAEVKVTINPCLHTAAEDDNDCTTAVTCPACGTVTLEAYATHSYTEPIEATRVPATCVANGSVEMKCERTYCADHRTEPLSINKDNHTGNTRVENAKAGNCGYDGYTGDTVCECGKTLQVGSVIPATGNHSWDEGTIDPAPTCTTDGTKTFTCGTCSNTKTETVPAGHTLVSYEAKAPTCTDKGWDAYEACSKCNYSTYVEIDAKGHSYSAVVTPPDFGVAGYTTYTCSGCGNSYKADHTDALVAVAKIGQTRYASLQAAMDAAKDGDTVTLLTDVALSKYLVIYTANNGATARKITLDLNGKTISPAPDYKPSDYSLVFVGINQTLTVTGGGTITSNQRVTLGVYGVLNLENASIVSTGTTGNDAALAIWHWDHDDEGYDGVATGTANITGGTVDGCAYSEGYLTITGGAIDQVVVKSGTATVTGGTFSTPVDPAYIAKGYCAKAEGGKYVVGPHVDENKNNICDNCGVSLCENHAWQDATCTTPKSCSACGMIEGKALDHSYTYVADDAANTITESCPNGCKHSATITLKAPENAVYNASSWAATATATDTVVAKYEISYNKEPINAGTYTATLTVAGKSVSVTFEIAKAASTATAPTANTLTYNGKDQALINAGTATGGTMQYSLDGTTWSTSVPTAKDAGTYTVYYMVVGDTNHEDTQASSLTVTIGACTHAGNTNQDDNDCTTEVCCSVCKAVLTEAKASHTPEEDDGDCTTAVKCANCDQIAIAANNAHTPGEDDGNCTTAVKCVNCDQIAIAANSAHTPAEDDGNCTTAVKCVNCDQIATAAKASHTPEEDDGDCTTAVKCANCDQNAIAANSAHTPGEDDGDCTTAVKCVNCDQNAIVANSAHTPGEDDGDCTTAVKCVNCDQIVTPAKASHTPEEDDGNCTTAVKCANCDQNAIAAKASHTPEADDGDCTTAVKCANCNQIVTPAKASHTPAADDDDCTTAIHCTVCNTVTTEAKASHTPAEDDGNPATAILCTVCGKVTTPAKVVLYLKPNANWYQADARFAAYFFGNGETWVDMTDPDGDGIYAVIVPDGYSKVIFCRMNPGATANNWNNKWNQTADLTVPTDNKNVYDIADGSWDVGQWATYPEYVYFLRGSMNNWGTSDPMTAKGNGIWTVTMTLAAGNYEYKAGNDDWGLAWPTDNATLALKATSHVTFTLNVWEDTLTVQIVCTHDQTTTHVTATCTQDGTRVETCACGEVVSSEPVAAYGHNLEGADHKAPTCTLPGYKTHKCTRCDYTERDDVAAFGHAWVDATCSAPKTCANCGETEGTIKNHNWGSIIVVTKPTCTEGGVNKVVCGDCGAVSHLPVAALDHDEIHHNAKAPTCNDKGWDAYVTCSRCDYSTYAEKAALGHNLEGADHKAPTCTEPGYKAHKCTRCDYTESTDVPALGHAWVEPTCSAPKTCANCGETEGTIKNHGWGPIIVVTEPTCTKDGVNKVVCGDCGAVSHLPVAALGHDKVSHEAKAPTCADKGWDAYETCSRCDYTTYVELPAAGHSEVPHAAKAPTCTEKGWDAYVTCSKCDYSTYAEKAALGHNLEGADHKAPTCTEPGYKAHKCTRCDYTESTDVPALGHAWVDATCSAPKTCANCGKTEGTIKNHSWGPIIVVTEPTCTEGGVNKVVCGDCGAVSHLPVAALGHDKVSHEAKAPTCADKGWAAYETCSRCDYTTYVEAPAAGHSEVPHAAKAPTCTEKGWDAYVTCSKCDYSTYAEKAALGHNLEGADHKAPTCTESGYKAHRCTRCDYTETYETPALGHAWVDATCSAPKTCANCGKTEGTIKNHGWGPIIVVTEPTCTEGGVNKVVCGDCGAVSHLPVASLGHDKVSHDAKAPTCADKGWAAYETCSRCDYTTYVEAPAAGHSEVSHDAKAPTCTEKGWDTYVTCSRCDYSTYAEKAALGHDEVSHDAKAPTCTEKGWDAYVTCSRCDYSTYAEKAALGHDEVSHEAKAPTCTAIGWDTYVTCSRCDYTTYVEIPATGHAYKAVVTAPTCTTEGYTTYTCACGDTYVADKVAAKGHTPGAAATCTTTQTCTVCGAELAPAKGHEWKQATCTDPKTCTTCGVTEGKALGHNWLAATCLTPKTCTFCKETVGKPVPHIYSDSLDGTCNICEIHRDTTENRTVLHMFRMYDPNSGEHFYTGSEVERDNLIAAGWMYEGVGFSFSETTGAPVHRLYDPVTGEHLYTMDEAEKAKLLAAGWNYEGVAFNSAYDTEVPQYRLFDPKATRGAYMFTGSIEERDFLISIGWVYQGIAFYSSWC